MKKIIFIALSILLIGLASCEREEVSSRNSRASRYDKWDRMILVKNIW